MPKEPEHQKLLVLGWLIACVGLAASGCQRRAYTDLYAESMASEIRELEDRIYEYDAAYQGIEEELAVLQSENARLHNQLAASSSGVSSTGRGLFKSFPGASKPSHSNESYNLRESPSVEPEPSFQIIPKPDPAPSIVPKVPPQSAGESKIPSVDKLPAPSETKAPKPTPRSDSKDSAPPAIEMGTPSSSNIPPSGLLNPGKIPAPPSGLLNPGNTIPPSPVTTPPAGGAEDLLPPPNNKPFSAPPGTGAQSRASRDRSVQTASSIVPVSTNADTPLQSMPADTTAIQALPSALDDDAIDAGRIELPGSIRSAESPLSTSEKSRTRSVTQDNKVIEVVFHPTLCRGQYLGSSDSGDGMHLVLQPRNASGEPLDIPAALTVVVLDPNRPEEQSKLGRWTLSKEEVDAALEPIGIARGFHIGLKWQDAKPSGDAVQVYIRYEMDDGRRLVNERRLQIHIPSAGSASWTPRVAK